MAMELAVMVIARHAVCQISGNHALRRRRKEYESDNGDHLVDPAAPAPAAVSWYGAGSARAACAGVAAGP